MKTLLFWIHLCSFIYSFLIFSATAGTSIPIDPDQSKGEALLKLCPNLTQGKLLNCLKRNNVFRPYNLEKKLQFSQGIISFWMQGKAAIFLEHAQLMSNEFGINPSLFQTPRPTGNELEACEGLRQGKLLDCCMKEWKLAPGQLADLIRPQLPDFNISFKLVIDWRSERALITPEGAQALGTVFDLNASRFNPTLKRDSHELCPNLTQDHLLRCLKANGIFTELSLQKKLNIPLKTIFSWIKGKAAIFPQEAQLLGKEFGIDPSLFETPRPTGLELSVCDGLSKSELLDCCMKEWKLAPKQLSDIIKTKAPDLDFSYVHFKIWRSGKSIISTHVAQYLQEIFDLDASRFSTLLKLDFVELCPNLTQGELLYCLKKQGIFTDLALQKKLNLPEKTIAAWIQGKAAIFPEHAQDLGQEFGIDPSLFVTPRPTGIELSACEGLSKSELLDCCMEEWKLSPQQLSNLVNTQSPDLKINRNHSKVMRSGISPIPPEVAQALHKIFKLETSRFEIGRNAKRRLDEQSSLPQVPGRSSDGFAKQAPQRKVPKLKEAPIEETIHRTTSVPNSFLEPEPFSSYFGDLGDPELKFGVPSNPLEEIGTPLFNGLMDDEADSAVLPNRVTSPDSSFFQEPSDWTFSP